MLLHHLDQQVRHTGQLLRQLLGQAQQQGLALGAWRAHLEKVAHL